MNYERGNINACLSEVCRLWSPRFHEKGFGMYFLANDKLQEFPSIAPKVERMVSNLLENASKFTPAGGTVWLHAEPYMWERRAVTNPAGRGSAAGAAYGAELGKDQRVGHRARNSAGISAGDIRRFFPPADERNNLRAWGSGWPSPGAWCTAWGQDLGGKRAGSGLQIFIHRSI